MNKLFGKYISFISAFFTVLFWASAFPAVKYSLSYYSPGSIMLMRFLVASAVLFCYCFFAKIKMPAKNDLPMFCLTGLIGIFAYMWLFNTGTALVTSGLSSFIIAACPVFTLILSIIFLKEKADKICWLGILTSFAGLLLIASTQVTGIHLNFGVILLIGAAICTSTYNILQRNLLKKYTPIQTTAYSVYFATAAMLIFLPQLLTEMPSAPLSADLVIVYMGIFPAALSYFLWGYALSKAEKTIQVTSFLYLSPFIATSLSFVLLGERLDPLALLGGVIIIVGMIITNFRK